MNDANLEQELRDLVAERVAAVRAKDPEALAARQADDIVIYDVLPPLQSQGRDAGVDKTQAWFDSYASDIDYQVHDSPWPPTTSSASARSSTTSAAR